MINKLKIKTEFNLNVFKLMTGVILAQAIPIATSPFLTRLYSPDEFGILVLFISIVSILTSIVCLRYEKAIVQPVNDQDAKYLVIISLSITVVISIAIFVFINLFYSQIEELLDDGVIIYLKYWVPLTVLITGSYNVLYEWHVRKKQFSLSSKIMVSKGAVTACSQVGFGIIMFPAGLIIGYFLGFILGFLLFLKSFLNKKISLFNLNLNKQRFFQNIKKYKNMPQYSTWGGLADNISSQLPILFIAVIYNSSIVGIFGLTLKVLSLPSIVITQALSSVLFQKVSQTHNQNPQKIQYFILKIFLFLSILILPFTSIIWLFGEELFVFVFGEPWRESGIIASTLVFALAAKFIISPLSVVLILNHNIKLGTIWQLIYFISISVTLYLVRSWSLHEFLLAYVFHEIVLYLLYFIFILRGSKYSEKN